MQEFDFARLSYLVILLCVLGFWFFVQNRDSLGTKIKQGLAWVFIFIGVLAAYGLWDDVRSTVQPSFARVTSEGQIVVPRAPDGHYYLTLRVNNTPVEFLVDTGATDVVLTKGDAKRVGINLDDLSFFGRAMTANGAVRTAPATLDLVEAGDVRDTNLTAWVNEGEMEQSLLGMAYLQRWSKIEIANRGLVLTR